MDGGGRSPLPRIQRLLCHRSPFPINTEKYTSGCCPLSSRPMCAASSPTKQLKAIPMPSGRPSGTWPSTPPPGICCSLHQFVTGAQTCESEELSVGGSDNVDASVFNCFDYVAPGPPPRAAEHRLQPHPLLWNAAEILLRRQITIKA